MQRCFIFTYLPMLSRYNRLGYKIPNNIGLSVQLNVRVEKPFIIQRAHHKCNAQKMFYFLLYSLYNECHLCDRWLKSTVTRETYTRYIINY